MKVRQWGYRMMQWLGLLVISLIFLFLCSTQLELLQSIHLNSRWLILVRFCLYLAAIYILPNCLVRLGRIKRTEVKRIGFYLVILSIGYELMVLST